MKLRLGLKRRLGRWTALVAAPAVGLLITGTAAAPPSLAASTAPGWHASPVGRQAGPTLPHGLGRAIRASLGTAAPARAQTAELTSADGMPSDSFGWSVAVSADGKTAVVGALYHWYPNANAAAYIFSDVNGTWKQTAELIPSGAFFGDELGQAVAISATGSTVVLGAPNQDTYTHIGAAYVFTHAGTKWKQTATLYPPDLTDGDLFGGSLAISADGTRIAVSSNWQLLEGQVFVFTLEHGAWKQTAEITDPAQEIYDGFGAVAMSADGSTLVVGAAAYPFDNQRGTAYVFTRSGVNWTQVAQLNASDGVYGDYFGSATAISANGSTIAIGAFGHSNFTGAVYVFGNATGSWKQTAKLAPSGGVQNVQFGQQVSISGNGSTVIGGDRIYQTPGAAYVFSDSAGTWAQTATLTPSDGRPGDFFGNSVAVSANGSVALVGEPKHNASHGAVYTYQLPWKQI